MSLEDRTIEQVADTGGFCLGMAFNAEGELFVCDSRHAAVFRFRLDTGRLELFAKEADGIRLRIPNYPAFDNQSRLYVSDSHEFKDPGPGIFRFTPDGRGELWYGEPLNFANGLAFTPDCSALYVVESFPGSVSRGACCPIGDSPGAVRIGRQRSPSKDSLLPLEYRLCNFTGGAARARIRRLIISTATENAIAK